MGGVHQIDGLAKDGQRKGVRKGLRGGGGQAEHRDQEAEESLCNRLTKCEAGG